MIRLFPIIIEGQVKEGNKGWECYINFVLLVERHSAPYFSDSDLAIFELLKDDFFIVTLKIFPDTNLKHKAHFLRQYTD